MTSTPINFVANSYNAPDRVYTAANGTQYYISADNCDGQLLQLKCDNGDCKWGAWVDDTASKNSCVATCSNYVYKQTRSCPGGNCGASGVTRQYQWVPCGPYKCATKTLTDWDPVKCSECGGGEQRRSCVVTPSGVRDASNLPPSTLPNTPYNTASFSNRSNFASRSYYAPQPPQNQFYPPGEGWLESPVKYSKSLWPLYAKIQTQTPVPQKKSRYS